MHRQFFFVVLSIKLTVFWHSHSFILMQNFWSRILLQNPAAATAYQYSAVIMNYISFLILHWFHFITVVICLNSASAGLINMFFCFDHGGSHFYLKLCCHVPANHKETNNFKMFFALTNKPNNIKRNTSVSSIMSMPSSSLKVFSSMQYWEFHIATLQWNHSTGMKSFHWKEIIPLEWNHSTGMKSFNDKWPPCWPPPYIPYHPRIKFMMTET